MDQNDNRNVFFNSSPPPEQPDGEPDQVQEPVGEPEEAMPSSGAAQVYEAPVEPAYVPPTPQPAYVPPPPVAPGNVPPKNNNRRIWIIVLIVLVVLCCCCLLALVLAWNYGDQVVCALDPTIEFCLSAP